MRPRAGTGPPDDLTRLYAAQYEAVRRTLVLFTGHRLRGEALAREVFVRTCQRWDVVRTMGAPRTWLYREAIGLAITDDAHGRTVASAPKLAAGEAEELEVFAVEGEIAIIGPDGAHISLTPQAAAVSARRLLAAVDEASGGGEGGGETYQKPLG